MIDQQFFNYWLILLFLDVQAIKMTSYISYLSFDHFLLNELFSISFINKLTI